MSKIVIYTDGSCISDGYGGYAFVMIRPEGPIYYVSGGELKTTNNRMELMAVLEALQFANYRTEPDLIIYSDSKYVINCAEGKWGRKKNIDLWEMYDERSKGFSIDFRWVKGHSGNKWNDKADFLAKKEALEISRR